MQEIIKNIKHQFMTYRNGAVADSLRAAGINCYRIIFGLNVPQLSQISATLPHTMELAEWLWNDSGVRESRLLATYIFPTEYIDMQYAQALINSLQTYEEADMLCFRLLKRLSFARRLADTYANADSIQRYCSRMLLRHIGQ